MRETREEVRPSSIRGVAPLTEMPQSGIEDTALSEEEWGRAQQRLILYLRSLKVPPFEVLELALDALKLARQEPEQGDKSHPVTASMRALRRLLIQRQSSSDSDDTPKDRLQRIPMQLPFREADDPSRGIQSMPPLNRGVMVPEGVHQKLRSL